MLNSIIVILAAGAVGSPTQPSASPGTDDSERKICQVYEETGSRLNRRRVCHTARQWLDLREQQRGDVERAQQNVGHETAN